MSGTLPSASASLRVLAGERRALLVPGVPGALAARLCDALGYEVLYLTGAGLTNMALGLPDLAFIDLTQLAQTTAAIREVTELPLIVDADTGFGNAVNVGRTVRVLERAGASAIQIEDQASPKRCGHFDRKALVPAREMAAKVRAAVDARRSADTLVMARTDARAIEGLDAALDRAALYVEAGADLTFVEAPIDAGEMRRIAGALPVPQLVNIVAGGRTPALPRTELEAMGFAFVLYANTALQGAIKGMRDALSALLADGRIEEGPLLASFADRQRLVDKPAFDELERRYAG